MKPRGRVARNVRRLRVDAGLSQEALAADAGLVTAHISRIERAVSNPTLDVLTRIARALRADIALLFVDAAAGVPPVQNLRRGRKRKKAAR